MRGFGEIAERLRRATVQVFSKGHRGRGSGIVWDASGLVLTNSHVAVTQSLDVELWDGRSIPARVTSRDVRRDLVALRLSAPDLTAAEAGDSDAVRAGELVLAVGSPLGFSGALSTGVVHSIGALPGMGRESWIRAGVQLAPGNSGGPLANARGQVIGINTAIVNGLGAAVPSNAAKAFVLHGARPSLGVSLRPVREGLLILDLDPDGPAAAASLRAGDVLTGSLDTLAGALDSGVDVLRLHFFRGDTSKLREAFVKLHARAAEAA